MKEYSLNVLHVEVSSLGKVGTNSSYQIQILETEVLLQLRINSMESFSFLGILRQPKGQTSVFYKVPLPPSESNTPADTVDEEELF